MALINRGVAAGGVLALVVQVSGPTPLRSVVSGAVQLAVGSVVELPVHAHASAVEREGMQGAVSSLPHLQIPECHDAVCAGR